MIHIVFDQIQPISDNKKENVSDIQNYVEIYADILRSLNADIDMTTIVSNQVILQWLKNLSQRYPPGTFVFETMDARQALAQKWGVSIPADARNDEIQAAGLLQFDLRAQPGQSFADLLLVHFYGPLFAAKTFPFTQLPQLLQAVESEKWQALRANPLPAHAFHQRVEAWEKSARSVEQRQVIELFAANPSALRVRLMQFRVLRAYPSLGETRLGDLYGVLNVLKLPLQDLAVEEPAIPDVVNQVTYHLNARAPRSVEEWAALLEQVSGLLWVEYDLLEKHLLAHPEWISPALLNQLADKFQAFARRLSGRLTALRTQIRPPKPSAPDINWDVTQMLTWATESYLPYQAWCSSREQFDKDLYALGDEFSAWLMACWNDLHANSGRMVFNILPALAPELIRPDRVHLVLVVDNLGWSFAEILRDLFQEKGFYWAGTEPYFAMLPTETEISKKCLLSGKVGYTAIDDKTYKGMLEKGWVPYFQDNAFRYLSDIGTLSQVKTLDARVYVVNYLAVDKTLHKSVDEIGMSHREHIRHLLEKLIENVVAFVEKHTLEDRIRIHIVSDHGSTQLPAQISNDLDPAFFKQPGFNARSHRYVEVSNERFATLADNLKLDCFFLPANDFLLSTNMICARRANRFLPTDKDVFVHGGLLPEEVIVPYMAFEPATVPLKALDILLKQNQFRYRLETVELEIGNPNEAAAEQVQVSVLNGNVEWEFEAIPLLNGRHNTVRQVTARFKLTSLAEEQSGLSLRVRFRARGESHSFDVKLPIVMRKMVEEKHTSIFDD